ncbi:MAG TPA: hypothetical protein PKD76_00900 [Solirubrobacterales bacterium]|nr:hypothetical protein [Solirubrobacterales bacterium]
MNSARRRSDPTLMLVILAGAICLAVWRALSNLQPGRVLSIIESLLPVAIGLVAIASALATQRFISTRRTLGSRRTVAVVPADEFEASIETILRVAAQLSRADRGVRGWMDRPASAIRIRLRHDAEGQLVYLIGAAECQMEVVRSALRSYQGIEIRQADELLPARPEKARVTMRTELVLARPSVEPLARLDLDPDPLQPFASVLAALDKGEEASVHLDLLPAAGRRRSRLTRRLSREARRLGVEHGTFAERLGLDRKKGKSDPATLAERRGQGRGLDAKLRDGGAVFEAQILIRTRAATRVRASATMTNLLAAFESTADRNWLKASGMPIPGLAFLGSDLPGRRGHFDRRADSGRFRPARRCVLTAREMAGFLKPPSINMQADNVLRSGAMLSPPPDLPTLGNEPGLIPIGRISNEAGERVVGVRAGDTFFTYIAGRSRFGKTEIAICQFLHLVRSGQGGLFLDPHQDAIERMKPYLTDPEVSRRVVEIDLGPAAAAQPGWNLFELGGTDSAQAEAGIEAVVDAFASALQWGERSTRAINLTAQSAMALTSIAKVLPPELCPTIFQLPTLLSDGAWRKAALPFMPRASQQFWSDRFPRLAEEAITPLTNMVDRLRASAAVATLLGASQSTYRIREAMDKGQIVLACPGSGGTRDRLIANLIVFDLLHAAKARADNPPEKRRPFWVFLDEVQTYDGAASGNLAALEQAAKYGIRAVLLNQNPERLTPATLQALTTNRSHLIATALNSKAASLITREWAGRPDPAALTRLPKYRFIAQVTDHGSVSEPFALGGVTIHDLYGPGHPGEITGAVETRSSADALAHLETLDDRILAELEALKENPASHETPELELADPIDDYSPMRAEEGEDQ